MQDQVTASTIRKEIEIEAPPDRVWRYVATQEGCRQWFCTAAEDYDLILEPRQGGRFEERLVAHGKPYHAVGKVLVYDPPRTLALSYRVVAGGGDPWSVDTRVTITLTEAGGGTRVRIVHSGFESLPDAVRHAASHDQGWTAAQEDLLALLTQQLLPSLGRLSIVKSIEVDAPAERVWWFIGTQEGNRARHRAESTDAHEYADELLEEHVDGRYELRGTYEGAPFRIVGRVLRYEPSRLLAMTWREIAEDGSGWPVDTLVTFRIAEYFGRTRLTVIHSGFEKLPAERRERAFKSYEIGRQRGIAVLQSLLASAQRDARDA